MKYTDRALRALKLTKERCVAGNELSTLVSVVLQESAGLLYYIIRNLGADKAIGDVYHLIRESGVNADLDAIRERAEIEVGETSSEYVGSKHLLLACLWFTLDSVQQPDLNYLKLKQAIIALMNSRIQ